MSCESTLQFAMESNRFTLQYKLTTLGHIPLLILFKKLKRIPKMASHLRIGIFGGGVVGGGVYELVQKCVTSGRFGAIGASMEIAKICVRDLTKTRDFELKSGCTLVTDYNDILGDPSINCVVELMGGVTRYYP